MNVDVVASMDKLDMNGAFVLTAVMIQSGKHKYKRSVLCNSVISINEMATYKWIAPYIT
jgi:hypothetical protein